MMIRPQSAERARKKRCARSIQFWEPRLLGTLDTGRHDTLLAEQRKWPETMLVALIFVFGLDPHPLRNFSGQWRKPNEIYCYVISWHFPENVNIKVSTIFIEVDASRNIFIDITSTILVDLFSLSNIHISL